MSFRRKTVPLPMQILAQMYKLVKLWHLILKLSSYCVQIPLILIFEVSKIVRKHVCNGVLKNKQWKGLRDRFEAIFHLFSDFVYVWTSMQFRRLYSKSAWDSTYWFKLRQLLSMLTFSLILNMICESCIKVIINVR